MFLFLITGKKSPVTKDFERDDFLRIRCPACGWQPSKRDTWLCDPGCGHIWNTFDTRALCPNCLKQWHATSCHRCSRWSPHDAWYQRPE